MFLFTIFLGDFNGFAFPFTVIQEDDKADFNTSKLLEATVKIEDEYQDSQVDSEEDRKQSLDLPQDFQEMNAEKEEKKKTTDLLSSFICKTCLKRFPTRKQLDNHHKTSHLKVNQGPFPCPIKGCSKVYKTSGIFSRHFRKDHRSKPPYSCKDCEQGKHTKIKTL